MTDYQVIVPDERYQIIKFTKEGLPAIGVINQSLREFEPKIVFAWHLSLIIDFEGLADNGMPTRDERDVVDAFGDSLDAAFKGEDRDKPNALFLARITWNKTRQLLFRVYDPEPPHQYLSQMIEAQSHPRQFDYRIENDPDWEFAAWYLNAGAE